MKDAIQQMVREALVGFKEALVPRTPDHDLTDPAQAYVNIQRMVGQHGQPSKDGLTINMPKPVGDIIAVTLDKNGGVYDLIATDVKGAKRRLDAESFLEQDKMSELNDLANELTVHLEGSI